jgi:diaminopimelate epimerase
MTQFFRLSGGGNDFLALVEAAHEPQPEEIQALCRRGLSAGADGLFILRRSPDAVIMKYFNADGYPAELCLNGTRCAVRLAAHLGWGEEIIDIETHIGRIRGRVLDPSSVAVEIGRPETPRRQDLEQNGQTYSGWRLAVGVPHFVLPWPDSLAVAPVADLGPVLRRHRHWGDAGANINFVRFVERRRLEIRTFERGVEAETLACGSGVIASTAVGLTTNALELPVRAQTLGGFELEVAPVRAADSDHLWSLTGDARLIAEGTLHPGALEVPAPPTWTP